MPMDTSRGSLSSKKQILSEEQNIDRLSNLPDCVLLLILSMLTTKDVVRTSVLARRWQYLWTRVTNIDLKYGISYKIQDKEQRKNLRKHFLEFMDRLFVLHNTSNIKELSLKLSIGVDSVRLNSWLRAIIKHNVQYLDLEFDVKGHPKLPLCLFDHHSFVVLKLNLECTLKVPVGTHLPYLKKLYLSRVRFMDDLSVQCLFSSCPVLDELNLVYCEWENLQNVSICIPLLRNLSIENDVDEEYFGGVIDREYISNTHVKIVATNLACLTFSSYLDINFEVSGLSSLKEASIYLPYDEGMEEEIATRTLRLFSQVNNIESMTLWATTVELLQIKLLTACVSCAKTLLNVEASLDHLPTFNNLTRLTVNFELCVDCSDFLLAFLDKMPKLEYLHLADGFNKGESREAPDELRDNILGKRVPSCFKSSHKTLTIDDFESSLLETLMIEYVLRNATSLESLYISSWGHSDGREKVVKAEEHLRKVPRGSKGCNIVFSPQ